MKCDKQWATAGVALSIVGVIAGCGTTNTGTTPATNVTNGASKNTANTAATQNSSTTNSTTTTGANNTASNQATQNATGTNNSANSPSLTLESVQVANNSIILVTTHGTMQTAYQNPKITTGVFTVTLVNMNLPQSISVNKTYTSNGISYSFTQNESNLILTARFGSNTPSTVKTGIGGGDMISFTFQ
ncbi:hypothetical protein [Alicyclobacillus ferrooxydans]|uniref:Lipoprotein n=1 Tax=Alicyclobacillus ferrooxydans TaxID=471514 RepID=A0A0P9GLY1_9BACL|nr:hypothetical protein [Alicyclobacillus ferrooxydans]KPV41283.1 hypothetical protein AN477_20735 [Alicyclobacillus ferrooxydans]